MEQSESVNELTKALVNVQNNLKGAVKDSENPFFKSSYADLESVWNACRDLLTINGLCVTQLSDVTIHGPVLVTQLMHTSGQWIRGSYPLTAVKQDPQSLGSATTYARRYALAAIVGIIQVDDDGETAMDRPAQGHVAKPNQPASKGPGFYVGNPGDVLVPFGRDQGRPIKSLSYEAIRADIVYWETRSRTEGKPLTGNVKAYVDAAVAFLESIYQSDVPNFDEPGGKG